VPIYGHFLSKKSKINQRRDHEKLTETVEPGFSRNVVISWRVISTDSPSRFCALNLNAIVFLGYHKQVKSRE